MTKSQTGRRGFASMGGGAKKKEGGKLILAIVLLVVAGVVVGWTQGWFGGKKDLGNGLTPEENAAQEKAFKEAEKKTQETVKKMNAPPPAGS